MASGANSYTYYPGGLTNNIIVVNPTVSTTYLVYGTLNQCSNSNQIDITVQNCTSIEKNNDFYMILSCFQTLHTILSQLI